MQKIFSAALQGFKTHGLHLPRSIPKSEDSPQVIKDESWDMTSKPSTLGIFKSKRTRSGLNFFIKINGLGGIRGCGDIDKTRIGKDFIQDLNIENIVIDDKDLGRKIFSSETIGITLSKNT